MGSKTEKEVPVPAGGRHDVDVSDPNEGVGPGHSNVSAVVHSLGATSLDVDGVMYVVHDFGSGTVAGVQTIGTGSATITSGIASASTLAGDTSFLTVFATDGPALVTVAGCGRGSSPPNLHRSSRGGSDDRAVRLGPGNRRRQRPGVRCRHSFHARGGECDDLQYQCGHFRGDRHVRFNTRYRCER